MSVDSLPDSLLLKVFSYLDPHGLCRCSQVLLSPVVVWPIQSHTAMNHLAYLTLVLNLVLFIGKRLQILSVSQSSSLQSEL